MANGELLLTLLVALLVFGPNKLPMLAEHMAKLLGQLNLLKQQAALFWHTQLKDQQLQENIRKAEQADQLYENELLRKESGLERGNDDSRIN